MSNQKEKESKCREPITPLSSKEISIEKRMPSYDLLKKLSKSLKLKYIEEKTEKKDPDDIVKSSYIFKQDNVPNTNTTIIYTREENDRQPYFSSFIHESKTKYRDFDTFSQFEINQSAANNKLYLSDTKNKIFVETNTSFEGSDLNSSSITIQLNKETKIVYKVGNNEDPSIKLYKNKNEPETINDIDFIRTCLELGLENVFIDPQTGKVTLKYKGEQFDIERPDIKSITPKTIIKALNPETNVNQKQIQTLRQLDRWMNQRIGGKKRMELLAIEKGKTEFDQNIVYRKKREDGTFEAKYSNRGEFLNLYQSYQEPNSENIKYEVEANQYDVKQTLTLKANRSTVFIESYKPDNLNRAVSSIKILSGTNGYRTFILNSTGQLAYQDCFESEFKYACRQIGLENIAIDKNTGKITATFTDNKGKIRNIAIKPHNLNEITSDQIEYAFTSHKIANSLLFSFEETAKEQS